jgi:hypothetical protein
LRHDKVSIQPQKLKSYFEDIPSRGRQLLIQDKIKFNSQNVKSYFEDNPRDRQLLRHEKVNVQIKKAFVPVRL